MRRFSLLFVVMLSLFSVTGLYAKKEKKVDPAAIPVVLDLRRPSDTDILMMRNGDKLTGTVLNKSFSIRSSYAEIKLNNRIIAGIDLEGGANNIEAIVTVNNNRFSGFIDDPVFVFKLQSGPEIRVRREKVLKVAFRVRERERKGIPQRQFLVLKNGDFFSGKVNNSVIKLATTYATIPVELKTIDVINFIGGKNVLTKIKMRNNDELQGVLQTEDFDIDLDVGGEIKVYQDRIDKMFCKIGYIPDFAAGPILSSGAFRGKVTMLDLGNGVKMKLALIPAGKFRMGSTSSGDEKPIHDVGIAKPFYMGVAEITQSQYQAIMGSNPSNFQGAQRPVEKVSWNDALSFCTKLSEKCGKTVRLPSEAEWEYACRAGSTTKYCFGDDASQLGQYAWYSSNSGSKTHSVMKKKPNAWGLYDMHGNVWEWCQDHWNGSYNGAPNDGSVWGTGNANRVLRGGSWDNDAGVCRSAYRGNYTPSRRYSYFGFRVVVAR